MADRVEGTMALLRAQYATTFGSRPNRDFARAAVVSLAMSSALDLADEALAHGCAHDEIEDRRRDWSAAGGPPGLRDALARLGSETGMPGLAEERGGEADEAFWRQVGLVARHRRGAEPEAPTPRT